MRKCIVRNCMLIIVGVMEKNQTDNLQKVELRDQTRIITNVLAKLGKNEYASVQVLKKIYRVLHREIQGIIEFIDDESGDK